MNESVFERGSLVLPCANLKAEHTPRGNAIVRAPAVVFPSSNHIPVFTERIMSTSDSDDIQPDPARGAPADHPSQVRLRAPKAVRCRRSDRVHPPPMPMSPAGRRAELCAGRDPLPAVDPAVTVRAGGLREFPAAVSNRRRRSRPDRLVADEQVPETPHPLGRRVRAGGLCVVVAANLFARQADGTLPSGSRPGSIHGPRSSARNTSPTPPLAHPPPTRYAVPSVQRVQSGAIRAFTVWQ
jgi:hypothetical protein